MTIWDTVDGLQEHPLLVQALTNVKEKINNCLSRSYAICDRAGVTNHKEVLLNLPGGFHVGRVGEDDTATEGMWPQLPPTEEHDIAVAETGPAGIIFNEDVVSASASTKYYTEGERHDLTTESYLALFEETAEHELAHMKMHHDRLGGRFDEQSNTPDGGPWFGESGFAVQRHLRRRAKHPSSIEPCILEPSDDWADRGFASPIGLRPRHLQDCCEDDEESDDDVWGDELNLDQLRMHMQYYPHDCDSAKRDREDGALADTGGGKRPKSDDDSGDDGGAGKGGGGTSGDGGGDSKPNGADEDGGGDSKPSGADEDGGGDSKPSGAGGQRDSGGRKDKLATSLVVSKVVFCDRGGDERTTFRSHESVYALVTFKNPTQSDIYLLCNRGTFKRRGVFMEIENCPTNYVPKPYPRPRAEVVCISPGKEHTFTRLMCKPQGVEPRVRLSTPAEPGVYVAKVKYHPTFEYQGSFSFHVANN